ncbi:PBECR2 nuclease fold domain-containing protein [Dongia sp.]|uniref:PBECR2 nuclease fold domain-containing protein n=1 Tax=Dongia sp. TaxID=1977262 RepID=UPI0035B4AC83
MPDPKVGSVPFPEAIRYFRDKVRLPTATWTDLWQGEHARAFVVAGAMKDDLLRDFQTAIQKAIETGGTLADFRQDFDRIVATHGWSYKGGRNWRTRVIFHTNLRMAYAAGKWEQAQRLKADRPFLRYVAVDDGRTREQHRAWHNTILPVDDPFWETHYPPNGWNCRCTTQSLSQRDLDRFGLTPSDGAPPVTLVDRDVNFPEGPRTVQVPDGIDPGFGYNPGQAAYGRRLADEVMDGWRQSGADAWETMTRGDWKAYARPAELPADAAVAHAGPKLSSADNMASAISHAIGGRERMFDLPDGSVVAVNAESLAAHIPIERAPFLPYLPELLTDPFEIWISFERHKGTGRVELRKRLVKVLDIGGKERGLTMSAQVVKGRLEAWTFFPTRQLGYLRNQRRGRLLFGRRIIEPGSEGE